MSSSYQLARVYTTAGILLARCEFECVWSVISCTERSRSMDYIHRGAGGSGRRFSARPVRRRHSNILFSSRNGDMYQNMRVFLGTAHRKDLRTKPCCMSPRILKHLVTTGKAPPGVDGSMFEY